MVSIEVTTEVTKMNTRKMTIEDLGWDENFRSAFGQSEAEGFDVARVVAEFKGAYKVIGNGGEYLAKITGKRIFSAESREDFPAVGDWVAIKKADAENAVIHKILPRRTAMKRKYSGKNDVQIIAANIDTAFAIESVDRDFNLNRFERYFAIAKDGGIRPAIILNKTDLISKEDLEEKLEQIKRRLGGIDVVATSTRTNEGLEELEKYLKKGKTYCFLGSSGVGKSSLINKLLGEDAIKTKEIGERSGRGAHTTTGREIYFLKNGAIVIDNPGVREVGMTDTSEGIDNFFDEISELSKNCKYADCTHTNEPGCAVLEALRSGNLDEGKYANYVSLKKEAEHYEMTELEKRTKGKQFGKFMKNTKKIFKKSGFKDF